MAPFALVDDGHLLVSSDAGIGVREISQSLDAPDPVSEAIRTGKYPIDLDKLASRIVDDDIVRGTAS